MLGLDLNATPSAHAYPGIHLRVTPEIEQSLRVLAMGQLELKDYLQREVEENPCLELLDHSPETGALPPYSSQGQRMQNPPSTNLFPTLVDDLLFQIKVSEAAPSMQKLAIQLLDFLSPEGYMEHTVCELAAMLKISVPLVESAIALLQSLDPPGIAAYGLRECLLLQLDRYDFSHRISPIVLEVAKCLVQDYLALIPRKKVVSLAKFLSVDPPIVKQAIQLIRTLNPQPGYVQTFRPSDSSPVFVDASVKLVDQDVHIYLNESLGPVLRFSEQLPEWKERARTDLELRIYVEEKLRRARSLLVAVERRRRTLLQVLNQTFTRQHAFLLHGPSRLVPLSQAMLADELSIHPSTVSRTVRDKWIQTPFGTLPFKYMFHSAPNGLSQQAILHTMTQLVRKEVSASPLTDYQISEELSRFGYRISRRTVAKYRKILDILPASARRRK